MFVSGVLSVVQTTTGIKETVPPSAHVHEKCEAPQVSRTLCT